jgi:hypothetical protein
MFIMWYENKVSFSFFKILRETWRMLFFLKLQPLCNGAANEHFSRFCVRRTDTVAAPIVGVIPFFHVAHSYSVSSLGRWRTLCASASDSVSVAGGSCWARAAVDNSKRATSSAHIDTLVLPFMTASAFLPTRFFARERLETGHKPGSTS